MKKLIAIGLLALSLGACVGLQTLQLAIGTSVSPTQALIAANAFDAAEAGATAYLVYCKANLTTTACSTTNRRSVIQYTRAGRAARNQIETYVQTLASVPTVVYNTLVTAVANLKATPASN